MGSEKLYSAPLVALHQWKVRNTDKARFNLKYAITHKVEKK